MNIQKLRRVTGNNGSTSQTKEIYCKEAGEEEAGEGEVILRESGWEWTYFMVEHSSGEPPLL